MGKAVIRLSLCVLFLLLVAVSEGAPPNPKKVKCKDKKSPCYNKQFYCPNSCLRTCVVDCNLCQPVCTPPPPPPPPPPPVKKPKKVKCKDKKSACYNEQFYCPASCPRTCVVNCNSCQPVCSLVTPPPPPPPPPPPAAVSEGSGTRKARCNNRNYTHCYGMELNCPSACPQQCEVDCAKCSPLCSKSYI